VDVDLGIADMVEYLNTIPGVRTIASCQGTIGEDGPNPYRAQVLCDWTPGWYDFKLNLMLSRKVMVTGVTYIQNPKLFVPNE
jgi:hypothetical protein